MKPFRFSSCDIPPRTTVGNIVVGYVSVSLVRTMKKDLTTKPPSPV